MRYADSGGRQILPVLLKEGRRVKDVPRMFGEHSRRERFLYLLRKAAGREDGLRQLRNGISREFLPRLRGSGAGSFRFRSGRPCFVRSRGGESPLRLAEYPGHREIIRLSVRAFVHADLLFFRRDNRKGRDSVFDESQRVVQFQRIQLSDRSVHGFCGYDQNLGSERKGSICRVLLG